jgi:hypothetical protein
MSRRRDEFERRTSVFEAAYRAWSNCGGLDPEDLSSKSAEELLDPLNNRLVHDARSDASKAKCSKEPTDPDNESSHGDDEPYPHEPFPRMATAHPFVHWILTAWLGDTADVDEVRSGLATLRTWWAHRRAGPTPSAVTVLGTEKMKPIVQKYERIFFSLAHSLIDHGSWVTPRSLELRLQKLREAAAAAGIRKSQAASMRNNQVAPVEKRPPDFTTMTPLERLYGEQSHQLAAPGSIIPFNSDWHSRNSTLSLHGTLNHAMPPPAQHVFGAMDGQASPQQQPFATVRNATPTGVTVITVPEPAFHIAVPVGYWIYIPASSNNCT